MKSTKELLGLRIREMRKARGWTQTRFAEEIDIDQKQVSRIEVGQNYPTIDRLEKMSEALNAPLASFFDFSHLKNNNERAAGIEEMLKELDKNSRKIAYRMIKAIILALKEA